MEKLFGKPIFKVGLIRMFKTICYFSLSLSFVQVSASERATLLDNTPSFCDMYYGLNSDKDAPDFCPPSSKKIVSRSLASANKKGQKIAFSKLITFDSNSSIINTQSYATLNKLAEVLNYKKIRSNIIRIEGHTDLMGAVEYNQYLSEQRALAVKRYLVSKGVEAHRLETMGHGFKKLYDKEHPKDGINRRVEFVNLGEL